MRKNVVMLHQLPDWKHTCIPQTLFPIFPRVWFRDYPWTDGLRLRVPVDRK